MQFGILGPLEVSTAGGRLPLGSPQQRALLADLLLHANEVVPRDRLIDDLWGDAPPGTATKIVQLYVSALRKALDPERRMLVTEAPGYRLIVDPEQLDASSFERLAAEGRRALAAGDPAAGADRLRAALALWRGPALADVADAEFARADAARLEELRLAALEDRIEAELALGRHAELAGELEGLVRRHPLRERLRAQQMLALARSGRQAEALGAYRDARRAFVEELGLEPGPELREAERAILAQAPEAVAAVAGAAQAPTRKTVTAVFVELTVAAPLDPELAARAVAEATVHSVDSLERHGTRVEHAAGSLVALFGVPRVREDDALRALRAALDVRAAVGPLVAVAICVRTGEAVLGADGAAAAALRPARPALPGEIVVAPETEQLVAGDIELARAHDGAALLRAVHADALAVRRRADSPLIGRTREIAHLREAFAAVVRSRAPALVTVLGPAGIGKSRLAGALAAQLDSDVLVARCSPHEESGALAPLAELLRARFGEDVRAGVAAALADGPRAELAVERLGSLTGDADETKWATRKLLEGLARTRPLVVVLDELEAAQPAFLDLVEHVAALARDAPLFLLCLSRPELVEARPAWGGERLQLEPLSDVESGELIEKLAGSQLDAAERSRVSARAEGNPLFIEQLLAVRGESNASDELPPTINALLAARLDLLGAGERDVLQRAAVVGREFWGGAIGDPPALEALIRKDLVVPARSALVDEDAYRFRHELIRDAAYRSLPKEARAELHAQVAEWLDRAAGDDYDEVVAYHLEQVARYRAEVGLDADEHARRAARRLAAAGRRAFARTDLAAGRNLLGRASTLLPPGDPDRLPLLPALGDALRALGEYDAAAAVLDEAAAGPDDAVASRARIARMRMRLRTDPHVDTGELLAESDAVIAALGALGDEEALADAWGVRAWIPWFHCHAAETAEAAARSIEHARRAGDRAIESRSRQLLLQTLVYGPTPVADAAAGVERLLETEELPLLARAVAFRTLSGLRAMGGRFDEARELAARDRTILRELGLELVAAYAAEVYAANELLAGDAAAGEREARTAYEVFAPSGELAAPTLAAVLARMVAAQGRRDEALELATVSERGAPAEDLTTQVQWRLARADALGDATVARAAVALAARTDFLNLHGDALVCLARVSGDPQAREEARTLYERKGNVAALALL